ncbi:MAG: adenylate cyclase, partial [Chthoniobacterales bacterium]|nr:adenylate cyclase [Chthoniobacterales bacterium]
MVGGLALLGALGALAFQLKSLSLPEEKSIAILPFRSLSPNSGDAFFAEGLREDVVSRLMKVQGLKVIGRPRADSRARQAADFVAIGRAVGARHLLTG